MSEFRFIHCSDLHLDAAFSGLAKNHPRLNEILREATFQSFENIVGLALKEKVDAVIIAGDVYDSADKSLRAQLKFRNALNRLSDAGIPSFVAHGNHDPLNAWAATLEWPERATLFPGNRVEAVKIERDGQILATVCGISYSQRDVTENLALRFSQKDRKGFVIGVLHTNVGGNAGHANYAPCKLEDLIQSGMDYWALGHIHARQILRESSPGIVYCGNSQARSYKEEGAKGCCLVTLRENYPPKIRFIPTDVVRFYTQSIDISSCMNLDQVARSVIDEHKDFSSKIVERGAVLRIRLQGRSRLHSELNRSDTLESLQEEVQSHIEGNSPSIWTELLLNTRGIYDLDTLRQGNDFFSDMITLYDEMAKPSGRDEIETLLKPLFIDWPGQRFLENLSDDDLQELLLRAQDQSLDQLAEDF